MWRNWTRWALSACVGVLVWSVIAKAGVWAYILPANFHLRKFVKERTKIRTLQARLQTTYIDGDNKRVVDERLFIRLPGEIRWEQRIGKTPKLVAVTVWTPNSAKVWKRGAGVKTIKRTPQPRFDFFAVSSSGAKFASVYYLLGRLRVRYRGTSLYDRLSDYREQRRVGLAWGNAGPAIVLGATGSKKTVNQFWLDKRHRYPVRFLGSVRKGGPRYDVWYKDYHKTALGYVFPGRTLVYANKRLVVESLLYRIKVNPTLSGRLFQKMP